MISLINYKDFATEKDFAINIRKLITYCKENGENGIVFPKDTYKVSGALAEERYLYISNHDNGYRSVIFIMEDMDNFTLDFSGSELIFDDTALPFMIINSKNIIIKNVKCVWGKPGMNLRECPKS